jgi:hypothetical protein
MADGRVLFFLGSSLGKEGKFHLLSRDDTGLTYSQISREDLAAGTMSSFQAHEGARWHPVSATDLVVNQTVVQVSYYRPSEDDERVCVGIDEIFFAFVDGSEIRISKYFDDRDRELFMLVVERASTGE